MKYILAEAHIDIPQYVLYVKTDGIWEDMNVVSEEHKLELQQLVYIPIENNLKLMAVLKINEGAPKRRGRPKKNEA